jgi:serine/threonine-protein kinase
MGSVDLAIRQEGSFERLFAIKRLRPEFVGEAEVRAMLLEEARLAGRVRHPNVVSVIDVGEDEQGPFLVMDYVEGVSAAELLSTVPAGALPMDICLRIARDAAEGLHAAHELTADDGSALCLVHRDVSPQNLLVGYDGVARVSDFGIAKALGRTTATSTGVLKGKLAYMAPEQLRFEEPDRRADLFALGVVLFELLSGQRLYRSEQDLDGPRRILTEPPPDIADHRDDAEPELVELLLELLAKERESRPPTAKAVARRLDAMLATMQLGGGGVDTSEFLSGRFAGVRAKTRMAVTEAVERARGTTIASDTTASAGLELGAVPRARPARGAVVLSVVVLAAACATAYAFLRGAAPSPEASGVARAGIVSAIPESASAASASNSPPSLAASGVPAPSASSDAEGTPGSQPSPAQKGAATPRRRDRASSAAHRPGGVPLWERY